MKTPEQIAKETLTRSTRNPMDTLGHIIHAIEADRAQRAEILATDDAVLQVIEEQGFDWDNYQPNRDQIEAMLARVGFLVADAMNADRAQRREIYIVQNDLGDVVDSFQDADEATAAYQDGYTVAEETPWAPGEYAEWRIGELVRMWEDTTGDTAADYALSEDDWKAGLDDQEAAEIARLIEWRDNR